VVEVDAGPVGDLGDGACCEDEDVVGDGWSLFEVEAFEVEVDIEYAVMDALDAVGAKKYGDSSEMRVTE